MCKMLLAAATCAAVLAVTATGASAASITATAYRCEADATWNVHLPFFGVHWAELTYDTRSATGSGCDRVRATLASDAPPAISQGRFDFGGTWAFDLFGVAVVPTGEFAGRVSRRGGSETGELTIVNDELNAVIAGVAASGEQTVVRHSAIGTCGRECYRTHMVWEGSTPPTG